MILLLLYVKNRTKEVFKWVIDSGAQQLTRIVRRQHRLVTTSPDSQHHAIMTPIRHNYVIQTLTWSSCLLDMSLLLPLVMHQREKTTTSKNVCGRQKEKMMPNKTTALHDMTSVVCCWYYTKVRGLSKWDAGLAQASKSRGKESMIVSQVLTGEETDALRNSSSSSGCFTSLDGCVNMVQALSPVWLAAGDLFMGTGWTCRSHPGFSQPPISSLQTTSWYTSACLCTHVCKRHQYAGTLLPS